jgi:Mg2+-importing ATPase
MIVLVIRSRKLFFRSKPGKYLLVVTTFIIALILCFPSTPFAAPFGFKSLPIRVILIIGVVIELYIVTAETIKKIFYRKVEF